MGPGKVQDEQCAVSVSAMICDFEKNVQPSKFLGKLDWMPPKLMGLLYSLLPTSSLLALRCCSKGHLVRFHAENIWEPVSKRLTVELHASRLRLETASDVCGPPQPPSADGDEDDSDVGEDTDLAGWTHDPSRFRRHPHLLQTPPRLVPRPLSVGHRGASGHVKGNSLASFQRAVALGADMIELDVCLDRSGEVIVHHDRYLPDGRLLENLALAQIKRVDPAVEPLARVLADLRASGVSLYLDIKTDRVVAPLMRLLHEAIAQKGWAPSRLLVASFNQYDMIEVNAHRLAYPATLAALQTCIIVDGVPISFAKEYAALGVHWCSIGDGCVLPSFLEDAHRRGIGVMVWTVNNASAMRRYADLGVDALVTDFPERFVAVRQEGEEALRVAQKAVGRGGGVGEDAEGREGKERGRGPACEEGGDGAWAQDPRGVPGASCQDVAGARALHRESQVMSAAYPGPLHQPRRRLVKALRHAWPLLRALEGRSRDPTARYNEEEKTGGMLPALLGEGAREGPVWHLQLAARQAEESATAVLKPRLPRRRRGWTQAVDSERVRNVQESLPTTLEKGGAKRGGRGQGGWSCTEAPESSKVLDPFPLSATGEDGKGGRKEDGGPTAYGRLWMDGRDESEGAHDRPFLPFERIWAQL